MASDITPALEGTFDSVYAQLGTADVFTGFIEASQAAGLGNAAIIGFGTNGSIGTFGGSDTGFGAEGVSTAGVGVVGISGNPTPGDTGVLGLTAESYSNTHANDATGLIAGVWGDTGDVDSGLSQYVAVIGTADSGSAGFFNNNSASVAAVDVINANGTGILAFDDNPAIQEGGVLGTAGAPTAGNSEDIF